MPFFKTLGRAFDFGGRSTRGEYFSFVIPVVFLSLMSIGICAIILLIPAISVTVRRLHDSGNSGLWIFLMFVPIYGQIFGFIFMLLPGNRGENSHGPDPRGREKLTEEEIREKQANRSQLRKDFESALEGVSAHKLVTWTRCELMSYDDFEGRTCRRSFWPIAAFFISTMAVARLLDAAAFGTLGLFSILALIGIGIPFAASAARRMRDTGRPGWWAAIFVVPVIGWIAL